MTVFFYGVLSPFELSTAVKVFTRKSIHTNYGGLGISSSR